MIASSGSGAVRGLKYPKGRSREGGCGSTTVPAFDCDRTRNHVWSYDFVEAQTHDGRKLRLMTLIDEFTRECLAIRVARRINSFGVIETMADAMLERGVPEHIRSDNGAEMTAKIVRSWLAKLGTKTLYIEPGSPWGRHGRPHLVRHAGSRVERLNAEIFHSPRRSHRLFRSNGVSDKHDQVSTDPLKPHRSLQHPKHPQPYHFTWIAVTRCSSLHSAGPKYPSGHFIDATFAMAKGGGAKIGL